MTNALVPTNAEVYRASTDAAGLCKEIVVATAMTIQDRKYVRVEGWQSIAIAHGCVASSRDVQRIEGGVRCVGEVRRMSDGVVIAEAEGFVGEDEATWFGGEVTTKWGKKTLPKRSDYAIRAMCQTRAISRACRSAFAHVVVMMNAGLSTTPAEEVSPGGFDEDGVVIDQPAQKARPEPPGGPLNAIKRLTSARAKELGLHDDLMAMINGCTTEEELDAWNADFDFHTAQCPERWLDALTNRVTLRREEIRAEQGNAALDAEFADVVR